MNQFPVRFETSLNVKGNEELKLHALRHWRRRSRRRRRPAASGPSSVSTMPCETRSQPGPIAARTGARIGQGFDDVFDAIDDQARNDARRARPPRPRGCRRRNPCRPVRASACNRSPSAPGCAAPTGPAMCGWARGTGINVSSSTTDSTAAAGKRDALTGDGHDQQKLVHRPLPAPAAFRAINNPARS